MPIDLLSAFIAVILAISLAAERAVAIAKGQITWLNQTKKPEHDRFRRLAVQLLAFGTAWVTAAFLTNSGSGFDLLGSVAVSETHAAPAWLLGFLASGGSALWNNILGYTKAVKEIRKGQLTEELQGPN